MDQLGPGIRPEDMADVKPICSPAELAPENPEHVQELISEMLSARNLEVEISLNSKLDWYLDVDNAEHLYHFYDEDPEVLSEATKEQLEKCANTPSISRPKALRLVYWYEHMERLKATRASDESSDSGLEESA